VGLAGEQVPVALGVDEEPDEVFGLVVAVDELLERVAEEVIPEDLEFIGLHDLVDLYVYHNYDSDEIIRQLAAIGL
jgi:hypothetical protein